MSGVDDQVLFSKMLVSMPLVKILDSCIVIMLRSPIYWDKNTSSFLKPSTCCPGFRRRAGEWRRQRQRKFRPRTSRSGLFLLPVESPRFKQF